MNTKNYTAFDLAIEDKTFLKEESNRGLRLMLEYEKPELALQKAKIASTIVSFGSARISSPEDVSLAFQNAKTPEEINNAEFKKKQLHWYNMAREFGAIASKEGGALNKDKNGYYHNVIATGGGPGLMEATNRGAFDVGAINIGFNIFLPKEPTPNPYSSPELTFRFHYFAIRKMHLVLRASALAVMPGGFGTLDEVMELLNLITTDRAPKIPIVLFDKKFWNEVINVKALIEHRLVSKEAVDLIHYADSAQEGWDKMLSAGLKIQKN